MYVFGDNYRMSGNWIYDYFMGSTLNPRIGSVDIKMFCEIRISWTLLFAIAMGAVSKQYELYGRVSGNAWLFAYGTALYLNACAKVSVLSDSRQRTEVTDLSCETCTGRTIHPSNLGHEL